MATPQQFPLFKRGQRLSVTDCFGKKFPCTYEGKHNSQALISINGGKMVCDPSQLSQSAN